MPPLTGLEMVLGVRFYKDVAPTVLDLREINAMEERLKILFVCSRNRRRSLTAETIFKDEPAWDVRSAGTEDAARIKVTAGQLGWADVVVVMEKRHKERLQQKFPEEFAGKRCVCFFIADDYEYMDAGLVEILREKMREHF